MAQSWGLDAARQVLDQWSRELVDKATRESGLAVQFHGVEAWLLAQSPQCLEEAECVLSVLAALKAGRTEGLEPLMRAAGEHRRDGAATSRVSRSFAPRAYGPVGGNA